MSWKPTTGCVLVKMTTNAIGVVVHDLGVPMANGQTVRLFWAPNTKVAVRLDRAVRIDQEENIYSVRREDLFAVWEDPP